MLDRNELLEIIGQKRSDPFARLVRGVLGILTPIYRLAIGFRNRRFDRAIARDDRKIVKRCAIPVISVGNITTGGTGKSPLVIWLTRQLLREKLKVVILSRGYQRLETDSHQQPLGTGQSHNDEALEMQTRLPGVPHLQNPDRYHMCQLAIQRHDADVIVLDDGFQHRQLHRDLDIVLIDATHPFGYDRLLPRGLLREPITALKRADVIVVTRCKLVPDHNLSLLTEKIAAIAPQVSIAQTETHPVSFINSQQQTLDLSESTDQPIFAFCGIGNPDGFFATLDYLGLRIVGHAAYPDHHHFRRADLDEINRLAGEAGASQIVCTMKDWVKIDPSWLGELTTMALVTELKFRSGENLLIQRIRSSIEGVAQLPARDRSPVG